MNVKAIESRSSGDPGSRAELRTLPAALREALLVEDEVVSLAEAWAHEDQCVVLARSSTKRSVDSSAMTARSMDGWKSNSNWARRLSSG
jgi:hypothetical protein